MRHKIIVTSGQPFTDIDALACTIAYTELLNLNGDKAEAVLPGPLNKSVTKTVKSWNPKFYSKPTEKVNKYVLVDISESRFFASFVKEKNIVEIFDHRHGFEDYWKEQLGNNSHIEMVGSCATLIWEEFVKRTEQIRISTTSANLLYTAILSNTLNFKASITTKRDTNAFNQISQHTDLQKSWIEKYFKDQDKEVEKDIYSAIINDTKEIEPIMAQLELWDGKKIIANNLDEIEKAILSFKRDDWFLTSPSISEGINYVFTRNPRMKRLLERTIDAKFEGDVGTTKKLWLRKEILKSLNIKH